jgi:hypothetical protein
MVIIGCIVLFFMTDTLRLPHVSLARIPAVSDGAPPPVRHDLPIFALLRKTKMRPDPV